MTTRLLISITFTLFLFQVESQPFYFGADLSYVNEMEDCGEEYKEDGAVKDVYEIFSDHQVNLVRLRLWHTPSWYDNLNQGQRYSDLADVKKSIGRAKEAGMHVLLDFHLSDNWADPGKQVVPAAWAPVVDNLPVLKDSLYSYVYSVLTHLHATDLLPEMVQIGNETNRGILLSQQQNDAGWVLDWDRNSQLFNAAIDAVQDVEKETGENIVVAIHAADPEDGVWLFDQFIENGVTDFDVFGLSYYWAWHRPLDIAQTGDIIQQMKVDHPGYEIMIFETGYIWTTQSNDNANNIISQVHPDYAPASPANQRDWLIAMTQEVINSGGAGVIYWEPAWISSSCWTQWGQGSHQEHATFFNFQNELIDTGGIAWAAFPYENLVGIKNPPGTSPVVSISVDSNELVILIKEPFSKAMTLTLVDARGQSILKRDISPNTSSTRISVPQVAAGMYFAVVSSGPYRLLTEKIVLGNQ